MFQYDRPFPFLLWKNKSDDGLKFGHRLQNVKILDTVVIKNSHAAGRGGVQSLHIDWFFYSEKKKCVLRRHVHNSSLAAFHNHFIKEQKPGEEWNEAARKIKESQPDPLNKKMILTNVKDFRTLQNGLVAMWRW